MLGLNQSMDANVKLFMVAEINGFIFPGKNYNILYYYA